MRYTIIQGPSFADIITGLRRKAFRRAYYAVGQLLQYRLVQSATGTSKQRGRFTPPQRINEMYHSKDRSKQLCSPLLCELGFHRIKINVWKFLCRPLRFSQTHLVTILHTPSTLRASVNASLSWERPYSWFHPLKSSCAIQCWWITPKLCHLQVLIPCLKQAQFDISIGLGFLEAMEGRPAPCGHMPQS